MLLARFFALTPKGIPSRRRCVLLTATAIFSLFAGCFYGLSDGALLPPALAAAVALVPSAILCIRFLVIPYGGWVPYLTSTIVLILGAPVLSTFHEADFGLIPSMIFGLMCGLALSFPAVVLSELPKLAARETSPSPERQADSPGGTNP